jgi:hypothetical protein
MIHLFRIWNRCVAGIRQAGQIVLLFDFDGTLSRIASRPELARLSSSPRTTLQALARDGWVARRDCGRPEAGGSAAVQPILGRIAGELRKRLMG